MTYKPYYMKDVLDNSSKELFNVISTFAGGGGSSTGYRLAGGKILCVNEFVEAAVDTYKSNYPNTPVLPDDIKKLKGEDFLKISGIQKGDLDKYIIIENIDKLEEIKKSKPVIFISAHFSNFELMAMVIEKAGVNLSAI